MPLQKGFLCKRFHFSDIPLDRKVLGPILGLGFAISFYGLLYVLRDICRALSGSRPEFFWDLSPSAISFYNFFLAAIAILLGQSFCITHWLNTKKDFFGRGRLFKIRIVNDQWFMNWYFLSWFSKMAFAFWAIFGYSLWGGHFIMEFYPGYRHLFYLILIVLFLQSWTSFRQLFPRQSIRWFLLAGVIVSVLSFALSKVNFVDQSTFAENYKQKSIYDRYDFSLPVSSSYRYINQRRRNIDLVIVENQNNYDFKYKLFLGREPLTTVNLPANLGEFRSQYNEYEKFDLSVSLFIDHQVELGFVEKIKQIIFRSGINKVYYMVTPEFPEYDIRYYRNLGIEERLHYHGSTFENESVPPPPPGTFFLAPHQQQSSLTKKVLKISAGTPRSLLTNEFKALLRDHPSRNIRYVFKADQPYDHYIRTLASAHSAIDALRKEYALLKFNKPYHELAYKGRQIVDSHYSLHFSSLLKGSSEDDLDLSEDEDGNTE